MNTFGISWSLLSKTDLTTQWCNPVQYHKTKASLRKSIESIPVVGAGFVAAYLKLKLVNRIVQSRFARNEGALPDPETVYWIDPRRIHLHTNFVTPGQQVAPEDRVFDPESDKGKVYDGDWDLSDFAFQQMEVYQAFESVMVGGGSWEQTSFYQALAAGVGTGTNPWSIHSTGDLVARFQYLDQLIESMRTQGYKLAHEVALPGEAESLEKHRRFGSEISVNIGRDGLYLFQDGRHRLAIAQVLGLEKVSVKVLVRHRKWIIFRNYLQSLATSRSGASDLPVLYQQPCHPDLVDIPAAHGCEDRLDAIRAHLDETRGTALDIGANLGYFCHGLEDLGFSCIAIEHQPQIAAAAQQIRDAERKSFRILSADLFVATEKEGLGDIHFDVVLALNIFHHFLKEPDTHEDLRRWLKGLHVAQMFFEPHRADEEQMQGSFRNYDEAEFIEFLLENSELNHSAMIHRCDDGRSLYKLWR
jgi:hypothetical protein